MKFRLTAKLWANLTSLVRSTNFTALQLHFRVSENFTNKKEHTHKVYALRVCSFCLYKGLGRVACNSYPSFAFELSNAMLALLRKCKFSAKDITNSFRLFFVSKAQSLAFIIRFTVSRTLCISSAVCALLLKVILSPRADSIAATTSL